MSENRRMGIFLTHTVDIGYGYIDT